MRELYPSHNRGLGLPPPCEILNFLFLKGSVLPRDISTLLMRQEADEHLIMMNDTSLHMVIAGGAQSCF